MSEPSSSPKPHPMAEDFQWGRLGQIPLTGSQLADKGQRTIRRLREWGIDVPEGSRLPRAIASVSRKLNEPTLPPEVVAAAADTILELYLVTHAQSERPAEAVIDRIRTALGGADVPSRDSDQLARNITFELELWALFTIGGIEIWFAEPDLVF